MTASQRKSLMSAWWPAACAAQGWDRNDRAKRLEVLSAAVGRQLATASDLNNVEDINLVVRHLGKLADNLQRTKEEVSPEIERARRLRWKIRQQVKTLNALLPSPPRPGRGAGGEVSFPSGSVSLPSGELYLASLIQDKFQQGAPGTYHRPLTIEDLSAVRPPGVRRNARTGRSYAIPSQLHQLVMVLARAIQARAEAPEPVFQPDPETIPF